MTSRERVMTALSHKEPDMVPFALGCGINTPARAALAEYLKTDMAEIERILQSITDLRFVYPRYVGPEDRNVSLPDGSHVDAWGVRRSPVANANDTYLEISHYPLADMADADELESYLFPSLDWYDFSAIPEQIEAVAKCGDYAILTSGGNIFESSWYMRGLDNMLSDLLIEKEFAHRLMGKVTDYFMGFARRTLEAANGKIDLYMTADDIGGQNGLLLSMPLWEEMLKPYHKRLNKVVHEYGAKVIYHSDGAVMAAVDGLIDMGIDILEALQFDAAGMDPAELKRVAGDRLCFHGGVSVQSTLPFGTPEDVEAEVKERVRVLGKGGGYILAPSHAVQGGTPPENLYAFLKATGRLDNFGANLAR